MLSRKKNSGSISKLIALAGSALGLDIASEDNSVKSARINELYSMLSKKNGFYCFDSALHVFPTRSSNQLTLEEWNNDLLWKKSYGELINNLYFFAEDIFGFQFVIQEEQIGFFDSETGHVKIIANDLSEWADLVLSNIDEWTCYPAAQQWQKAHNKVYPDYRLLPKIPFVAGGKGIVENLYQIHSVKGMNFRGEIAQKIKNLPDGTKIKFIIDE